MTKWLLALRYLFLLASIALAPAPLYANTDDCPNCDELQKKYTALSTELKEKKKAKKSLYETYYKTQNLRYDANDREYRAQDKYRHHHSEAARYRAKGEKAAAAKHDKKAAQWKSRKETAEAEGKKLRAEESALWKQIRPLEMAIPPLEANTLETQQLLRICLDKRKKNNCDEPEEDNKVSMGNDGMLGSLGRAGAISFDPNSANIVISNDSSWQVKNIPPGSFAYDIPGGGSFFSAPSSYSALNTGSTVTADPCHTAQPSLASLGKKVIDWLVPSVQAVAGEYGVGGTLNDGANNGIPNGSVSLQDPPPSPEDAHGNHDQPFSPDGPIIFGTGTNGSFGGTIFDQPLDQSASGTLAATTGWGLTTVPAINHLAAVDSSGSPNFNSGACAGSSLCGGNRFKVEVDWRDFNANTRTNTATTSDPLDGQLFFFNADNWEVLVKVLDGCDINNHFWVFAAATTNVEYTLEVTDTQAGSSRSFDSSSIFADGFESGDTTSWSDSGSDGSSGTYSNPLGSAADAITDTSAFATCP